MRRLVPLALALLVFSGCAMSRDELGRLETEVAARNAERQRTAGAELEGEGYVDAEAERRWARLDEEDRQRCLSRELGEAPMRVTLDELELTADPAATCDLFRGRVARLEAAGPVVLHAIPGVGVMRAAGGKLVLVRAPPAPFGPRRSSSTWSATTCRASGPIRSSSALRSPCSSRRSARARSPTRSSERSSR